MVASGAPTFPFCLSWANENWTRRWDGKDHEVLIAQSYSLADSAALIDALIPIFGDRRYLRVDGRPLFLVYRIDLIPDVAAHVALWRERCRAAGMADPYLAAVQNAQVRDPTPQGFDAAIEFPPTDCAAENQRNALPISKSPAVSRESAPFAMRSWSRPITCATAQSHRVLRGVTPMWDNTARRQNDGGIPVRFPSPPQILRLLARARCSSRRPAAASAATSASCSSTPGTNGRKAITWSRMPDSGGNTSRPTRDAVVRAGAPFPTRPTWDQMIAAAAAASTTERVERFGVGAAPAISVVMPIYNHANFLPQTLASIADQRDVDLELIAVDDGSTDASADIVADFARTAGFAVTLIRQPNGGAPRALNRGMAAARAPSIALVNSDDVHAPSRLQRMMRALADSGSQVGFSDVEFIDDEGRTLGYALPRIAKLRAQFGRLASEALLRVLVQVNVGVSSGNFVFRRTLVERIGGFADLAICHDWNFCLPDVRHRDRVRSRAPVSLSVARGQHVRGGATAGPVRKRDRARAISRAHPVPSDGRTAGALDEFLDHARRLGLAGFVTDPSDDSAAPA